MRTVEKRQMLTLEPGSEVWVWDSTWLPAVVLDLGIDSAIVKLSHGITFNVGMEKLVPRDSMHAGNDTPNSRWRNGNA